MKNSTRRVRRIVALTGAAIIAASGLAACAGDGGSGGGGGSADGTVTVVTLPAAFSAPVWLGVEQGFFEDEGLTVKTTMVPNAAAGVPLLSSGQAQFGFGNIIPFVLARTNGVPLSFVAGSTATVATDGDDTDCAASKTGGSINTAADLEGGSIAVPALKAAPELVVRAWLKAAGADGDKIDFVQLAPDAALQAIDKGDIDASYLFEPWCTMAAAQGYHIFDYPASKAVPGLPDGTVAATEDYLSKNPEQAAAFQRAFKKSVEYTKAHPDEARAIVGEELDVPADVLADLHLGDWTPDVTAGNVDQAAALLMDFGWIDEAPNADDMIFSGS
ncbi:ABC transporter substrate-binding protein [Nocardioides sp. GXZ039]|uniref:ABC transporter substrate-binding protein n=1 Tax=Nocardioides sp. GXZ039 TaxID=3136018 RepID=UPI0030F37057